MRFEHDTYDIDVYSLCESVYYSCNNDEYDYVLECVNDWIMGGGYDEDILLKDVLNEINYASLEKFAKAKGWEHNGFNFDNSKISKNRPDEKNLYDNYDLERFNSIKNRLAIRDAKRKGITHTSQLHTASITGQDKQRFSTSLGRSAEETDKYRDNMKARSKVTRDAKHSYLKTILSRYGYPITEKDLRQGGFFKHFTVSSLLSPNRDEKDKANKFIDDLRSAKYKKDHPEPPKSNPILLNAQKKKDESQANMQKIVDKISQTPKQEEPDPLRAKQGQSVPPPLPPKQEPPKSNTPLEDKKGKPVQTPPPPRPQQQEPPKSNTPVVPSNNTPSRLSRNTTWMKNNKVKTALGAGLGAAAIGGGIYAYKQYKNKPRSVIAKRIQALRGIYKKFMINAQRNPQKAGMFKRIAAKILSVIDKLMAFMQNTADGR